MAKKVIQKEIEEIKKALIAGTVIIGTERTVKNLKLGKVEKVFLTSNCPEDVKEQVERYAKLNKVKIITLVQPNDEMGALCKKPYAISVLSFVKGA
ncbi:ribosomal L7Ae/L30e/S12e/Gadd45 family protein [Nanoarchaeota archaeon]